jgi:hypothetical protein
VYFNRRRRGIFYHPLLQEREGGVEDVLHLQLPLVRGQWGGHHALGAPEVVVCQEDVLARDQERDVRCRSQRCLPEQLEQRVLGFVEPWGFGGVGGWVVEAGQSSAVSLIGGAELVALRAT